MRVYTVQTQFNYSWTIYIYKHFKKQKTCNYENTRPELHRNKFVLHEYLKLERI